MADTWIAPLPQCPVHGRMHDEIAMDRWVCPGWDGEGCPHTVRAEDLDWRPAGPAEGIQFNG